MLRIVPCHAAVSIRSPVVSFLVDVPRDRWFEIVLATDPRLFSGKHRHERTQQSFYSSRREGWMRARSGSAIYVLPRDALLSLLAGKRIHYLLAAFGGAPLPAMSSTPLHALESAPWLPIIADGTARLLGARRFGGRTQRSVALRWGGDDLDGEMDLGWEDDAPREQTPSTANAPLQPSQVVRVEIRDSSGAISALSHDYPIEPAGVLRLPRLEPIRAAGTSIAELRKTISEALLEARVYTSASVNVRPSETTVPFGVKLSAGDTVFLRLLDHQGAVLPVSGGYPLSSAGEVDLPYLGLVIAKDKTIEQLQAAIIGGLSQVGSMRGALLHVSAAELP